MARYVKGQTGNPGGRAKMPADLRGIAVLTTEELKLTISKYFKCIKKELDDLVQNPKTPALDLILIKSILNSMSSGDLHKVEYLFLRCLGRVTDKIEIVHPEPTVINRSNGEQVLLDVIRRNASGDVVQVDADGNEIAQADYIESEEIKSGK